MRRIAPVTGRFQAFAGPALGVDGRRERPDRSARATRASAARSRFATFEDHGFKRCSPSPRSEGTDRSRTRKPRRTTRHRHDQELALPRLLPLAAGAFAERPNILLIFTDDQGVHDVGSYGSEISTPHIDSLAASGADERPSCYLRRLRTRNTRARSRPCQNWCNSNGVPKPWRGIYFPVSAEDCSCVKRLPGE